MSLGNVNRIVLAVVVLLLCLIMCHCIVLCKENEIVSFKLEN